MISRTNFRLAGLLLLAASVCAAQVSVPDTPAGRTLQTWLDVFNSGDRGRMENYVKTIDSSIPADGLVAFRNQTGGFDLLSIESSEPLHIRFRIKEKASETIGLGNLLVKDGQPPTVETFGLRVIPPGVKVENVNVDAALRQKVVEGIVSNLNDFYVDAPLAKQMGDAVTAHLKAGDYDKLVDGDALASRLHKDLEDISHDRHLRVDFSPYKVPPMGPPSPEDEARFHQQMEHDNCAFEKVEILPNNIGYIKFNGFMDAGF
jgi:hypothetical protein